MAIKSFTSKMLRKKCRGKNVTANVVDQNVADSKCLRNMVLIKMSPTEKCRRSKCRFKYCCHRILHIVYVQGTKSFVAQVFDTQKQLDVQGFRKLFLHKLPMHGTSKSFDVKLFELHLESYFTTTLLSTTFCNGRHFDWRYSVTSDILSRRHSFHNIVSQRQFDLRYIIRDIFDGYP